MRKLSNRFDEHFSRALALLPNDYARMMFMAAMIGCLEECVGSETMIHVMDEALAISQGIGAAFVPQQQTSLHLVKR